MEIMYLGIVFVVVILLLALRRPLYQAILGGLLATAALYRIPPGCKATTHPFPSTPTAMQQRQTLHKATDFSIS